MIRALERLLRAGFGRVESLFDRAFGPGANPWHQLGALSFHYFWIVVASGIYVFVFFDTSISGAYRSVEALTHGQWYLGGVMRSLHRYASDAMAVTVTLHLLREFSLGRFRGARAFSWISGVPLLWLLFAAAIGGYWLVWDRLAQYVAVTTTEWLERLPVISDSLARTFLSNETLSDRLFSLMVFMHIAIPLFLLIGMFVHIKRLKLARTEPARPLVAGGLAAILLLSLVKPAVSMGPADLSSTVALVDLDWFYMNVYPLFDRVDPVVVWVLLAGVSLLLVALPLLSPDRQPRTATAAVVDPANCNGCSWCFQDCPYEAITMIPHESKPGHRQALVDPDLCTGCGICEGACPSATPFRHVDELVSGIQIPAYPVDRLRTETLAQVAALEGSPRLLVFGCDHALAVARVAEPGVATISLPCVALLPPSFVDFASRMEGVDGVVVSGCHPGNCHFRHGSEWMEQRLDGQRMPHLRTATGRDKLRVRWAGAHEEAALREEIRRFRQSLEAAAEPVQEASP